MHRPCFDPLLPLRRDYLPMQMCVLVLLLSWRFQARFGRSFEGMELPKLYFVPLPACLDAYTWNGHIVVVLVVLCGIYVAHSFSHHHSIFFGHLHYFCKDSRGFFARLCGPFLFLLSSQGFLQDALVCGSCTSRTGLWSPSNFAISSIGVMS